MAGDGEGGGGDDEDNQRPHSSSTCYSSSSSSASSSSSSSSSTPASVVEQEEMQLEQPQTDKNFIKASQVAVSEWPYKSPGRARSYEIEVRNLYYKLPATSTKRSWLWRTVQRKPPPPHQYPQHHPSKYILRNVSCIAKPGEILAVAGPSGAGKSTLLEVLAGRIHPTVLKTSGSVNSNRATEAAAAVKKKMSSTILVNNQPMDFAHFRRVSGYVMQHDALFPLLTVHETLMFSAQLRLPSSLPNAEKLTRVEALMGELGLAHVANSRIGNDAVRGVSGGERRRVSIGVDVIHDPAVLLLDEPTSGLDSAGALQVVGMLNNMAESHGRTIILSIHQPGFRILQLIHNIVLLANGTVIHHGSVALLATRLEGLGHKIPQQVNVLEYAIDTIDLFEAEKSGMITTTSRSKVGLQGSLQDLFLLSGNLTSSSSNPTTATALHDRNCNDVENQDDLQESSEEDGVENAKLDYANSRMREIFVLSQRFGKNIIRTRQLFAARTLQATIAGLGLGSIFLRLTHDRRGIQERYGFFAFTLTFLLSSTTEALPLYLMERQILMRETSRGAYRISSYVVSNTLVFLPFLLICSMLYSAPTYWLVGLNSSITAYLFFVLVVWLIVVMANSFVAFFSALVPNFIMGNSIISGTIGAFFLFSGYFISKHNIPNYWIFMHYLSLFKYPLDALLINEYSPEYSSISSSSSSSSSSSCFGRVSVDGVCGLSGKQVLKEIGLENESKWMNVGVMIVFAVVYRLLCWIVLCFKLQKH